MEQEKFTVDYNKIQNEVKNAVKAEQRYWTENDAKFRAIAQHVPTYEDFRQIVLASHLKPLDKGESFQENMTKGNKVWNSIADSNKIQTNIKDDEMIASNKSDLVNSKPKNNLEFLKTWRKLDENNDANIKWEFLKKLDTNSLHQLCQLNGELLGRFLTIFAEKIKEISEEAISVNDNLLYFNIILEMLQQFSICNRFELNKMFLKNEEVHSCKSILRFIEKSKLVGDDELKKLESAYLK
jgi:hypothetical protein